MDDYAIINLKDVEDSAVQFGHSPDIEARFARDELGCERTGISYQRFAAGVRQPFAHRHDGDEEIYVVLSGRGRIRVGDEEVEIGPLDAIRVAPGTTRAFAAGVSEPLEILAFGQHSPDDAGEMLPPDWPE